MIKRIHPLNHNIEQNNSHNQYLISLLSPKRVDATKKHKVYSKDVYNSAKTVCFCKKA